MTEIVRDIENIDCISRITDVEDGYVCFMCLCNIKNGTVIITLKDRRGDKESSNGRLKALCNDCLSLILIGNKTDNDIDSSTMDYFSEIYQDSMSIKEDFIECVENGNDITIDDEGYILIKKDDFDVFSEKLDQILYLKSFTNCLDKIRNSYDIKTTG